jgi:single-stranded-DNA-specific exonuclease
MITDLLNTLLEKRGIITAEQREEFLTPNYARDIANPFLLSGMERAVARILQAIKSEEKIIIFADYD